MNYTEFKEMLLDGTGLGPNGPAHEALPAFPNGWNQSRGAYPASWGRANTPGFTNLEGRGLAILAKGDKLSAPVGIEIADFQVWSYSFRGWDLFYDVVLRNAGAGGWLGDVNRPEANPYDITREGMRFTKKGERHYASTWEPRVGAVMGHWWASQKARMPPGHSGELACGLIRLTDNTPGARILGGVGLDYYPDGTTNNNKAPGPGVQKLKLLSTEWQPFGWITPSNHVPWDRASVSQWIEEHGLPTPALAERLTPQDAVVEATPAPPVVTPPPTPTPPVVTPPVMDDSPIIASDPTPTEPEHAIEPVEVTVGCDDLLDEIGELKTMIATLHASGDDSVPARLAELEEEIAEAGQLQTRTETALAAARATNRTLTVEVESLRGRVRAQLQTIMDELD